MKTFPKTAIFLSAALLAGAAALAAQTASPAYNRSQQKGSHNTEQRDETLPQALKFDRLQPYQAGVRNLEFDLVLSDELRGPNDDWPSTLQHGGAYNWKVATLEDALRIVHNWHLATPDHEVVTISLDLKDAGGDDILYAEKIEQVFTRTLGRENLYTPGLLQGNAPTLLAGAARGWPTIDQLRGKFILVFTGSDGDSAVARRRAYLSRDTKQRLAFVDIDQRRAGSDLDKSHYYTDGNRVFVNIDFGSPGWCELALAAPGRGFATRAYTLNNENDWNAALRATVGILATDKVRNHSWAKVGGEPIVPAPVPGHCGS